MRPSFTVSLFAPEDSKSRMRRESQLVVPTMDTEINILRPSVWRRRHSFVNLG